MVVKCAAYCNPSAVLAEHTVLHPVTVTPYLPFRYASSRIGAPPADASQDITTSSAVLQSGNTTITFRRERVTNDPNDVSLDQCVYFLYAWGGAFDVNTQVIDYHQNSQPSSTLICLPSSSVCPGESNVCHNNLGWHLVYVCMYCTMQCIPRCPSFVMCLC